MEYLHAADYQGTNARYQEAVTGTLLSVVYLWEGWMGMGGWLRGGCVGVVVLVLLGVGCGRAAFSLTPFSVSPGTYNHNSFDLSTVVEFLFVIG